MFLFYAIHYPLPEKEAVLIQNMHAFGELIKKQPGIIFVNTFKDPENGTLMALAIWESEEAFQASWPVLAKDAPSEKWETRPREIHLLHSAG
jgi:heme-degrading monooxygenase HmoA